ncbi:FAS1 domain-containing protein [Aspergillus californicus]
MQLLSLFLYFVGFPFFCQPVLAQTASESSTSTATTTTTETSTSTTTTTETASASPPSLQDAASSAGAGRWAESIANNIPPSARGGRSLYVPHDDSFPSRKARQAAIDAGQYLYQVSDTLLTAEDLRGSTGSIIETLDTETNLGGRGQAVLSHGQRDIPAASSNTSFPIQLFSGLGNNVTILQEDIQFDGGIIHIVSGPFTRPGTVSDALNATAQTSLLASSLSSELSSSLDTTESITVFAPSNNAITSALGANTTISESEITALVDAHVIQGIVAYSPLLIDNAQFQTRDGQNIVISTSPDGAILLNGVAAVIQSDIVVANGVIHVIDGLLPASGPTSTTTGGETVFTGAAGWTANRIPGLWAWLGASYLACLLL